MSPVKTTCPGCGAELAFRIDASVVVVCAYCQAVVARGDLGPEQVGKLGTFLPHPSPLELWGEGTLGGVRFQLTGHAQLDHPMGGTWDEWYALLDDGRWAWLAEAQGKLFVTFEVPPEAAGPLPPAESLAPGREAMPGVVVTEIGQGTYRAAAGELPFRLEPGRAYTFADLSAPGGFFATLDYGIAGDGDAPTLYRGKEITLADLGLATAPLAERAAPSVKSRRLACPHCDGSLDLVAPDAMLRVGCPYCGSLLDVREGALSILRAVNDPRMTPPIPLGAKGTFDGHELTVAGWLERAVQNEWGRFTWDELLLHGDGVGFRWLVRTGNGHWSYVEPVAAGDVEDRTSSATLDGVSYRLYDKGRAEVDTVIGAFPWKVEAGETASTADYIAPPYMLSREMTDTEVTWSRSTWLSPDEVSAAFGGTLSLSATTGVAPNQPWRHAKIFRHGAIVVALMLAVMVLTAASTRRRTVASFDVALEPQAGETAAQVWFSEPFELVERKNVHLTLSTPLDNSWAFVAGDLFDEENGATIGFERAIEYYHGVDGGESWTEGSTAGESWISAPPTGRYSLRLEIQRAQARVPSALRVEIEQGVWRAGPAFGLLLVLVLPLGLAWFMRRRFEVTRWEDSSLPSPYHSFSSGDDD